MRLNVILFFDSEKLEKKSFYKIFKIMFHQKLLYNFVQCKISKVFYV